MYAALPVGGRATEAADWLGTVELTAGESKIVTIPIERERFNVFDEAADGWKVVPGDYTCGRIFAGTAAVDSRSATKSVERETAVKRCHAICCRSGGFPAKILPLCSRRARPSIVRFIEHIEPLALNRNRHSCRRLEPSISRFIHQLRTCANLPLGLPVFLTREA